MKKRITQDYLDSIIGKVPEEDQGYFRKRFEELYEIIPAETPNIHVAEEAVCEGCEG
jgi:hypothetical protein